MGDNIRFAKIECTYKVPLFCKEGILRDDVRLSNTFFIVLLFSKLNLNIFMILDNHCCLIIGLPSFLLPDL